MSDIAVSEYIKQHLEPASLNGDTDIDETAEWLEALEEVVEFKGSERTLFLLNRLIEKGRQLRSPALYGEYSIY